MTEKVQTVLGVVDPSALGRTLTHEHLSINFEKFYCEPPSHLKEFLNDDKIELKNFGFIQRYPYSNHCNICFYDSETAKEVLYDLKVFKQLGGGCIVENTSYGIGRKANNLLEFSRQTGVHVVAGTGFYVGSVHSSNVLHHTTEQIYDIIYNDLTKGTSECPLVKSGFIGEVGSNYPLNDFEIRSIQATAGVQSELKCPVSYHPGRDKEAPFEIIRRHTEAGGIARKTVMSHLDRTFLNMEDFLTFADEFGSYCQLDLFGTEVLNYQLNPNLQMPSDFRRIEIVKNIIAAGHCDKILLSHDIHTKHRLLKYGGHGYCHIFTNVIPKMLQCGITQQDIDQITITNPQNWLQWNVSSCV